MEKAKLLLGIITEIKEDTLQILVQLNSFEEGQLYDEYRSFPIQPFKEAVKLRRSNVVEIEIITGIGYITTKFRNASKENTTIYKKRYKEAMKLINEGWDKLKIFENKKFE